MAVKLHKAGYDRAQYLIKESEFASFDPDWHCEKPTPDEVNHFLNAHSMQEYGLWFLGTDDKFPPTVKEHYVYPHGDLKVVQKSALEHLIQHADREHQEIVAAAKQLLAMIK